MKANHRIYVCLAFISAVLMGCSASTGPFLKPHAATGSYDTVNPACPGERRVVNFSPDKQYWVVLRVYATQPGDEFKSNGTELRVFIDLRYHAGLPSLGMFASEDQKKDLEARLKERTDLDYVVTASKPYITVLTPDGQTQDFHIPIFENPYDPRKNSTTGRWYAPGVKISNGRLNQFKVILPEVFVNEEKIEISPIEFRETVESYALVLNC